MRAVRSWATDSPRRLFSLAAGLFVLVVVIGHLTSAGHAPQRPKSVVRTAPVSTTTVAPTTTTTAPPLPPHQTLPAVAARAATAFIETWGNRELPPAVWHRRIAALVTAAEQPGFAAADYPTAVPAGVRIVGAPIGSGDRGGAEVSVLTTKFPADLILAVVGDRYLVASFET